MLRLVLKPRWLGIGKRHAQAAGLQAPHSSTRRLAAGSTSRRVATALAALAMWLHDMFRSSRRAHVTRIPTRGDGFGSLVRNPSLLVTTRAHIVLLL